ITGSRTRRQNLALWWLPRRSMTRSRSPNWLNTNRGLVAGAAEVTVVGRALLVAVGLAHRAVHIEDQPGQLAVPVGAVDPPAGEVHQPVQVGPGGERRGLEPADLAG